MFKLTVLNKNHPNQDSNHQQDFILIEEEHDQERSGSKTQGWITMNNKTQFKFKVARIIEGKQVDLPTSALYSPGDSCGNLNLRFILEYKVSNYNGYFLKEYLQTQPDPTSSGIPDLNESEDSNKTCVCSAEKLSSLLPEVENKAEKKQQKTLLPTLNLEHRCQNNITSSFVDLRPAADILSSLIQEQQNTSNKMLQKLMKAIFPDGKQDLLKIDFLTLKHLSKEDKDTLGKPLFDYISRGNFVEMYILASMLDFKSLKHSVETYLISMSYRTIVSSISFENFDDYPAVYRDELLAKITL